MSTDLRDKPQLNQKDILELNFIRNPGIYVFRRHYRTGLRSHIMEVLDPEAVENETRGIIVNGLKTYPRAEPIKMLRLFRAKFDTLKDAEEELTRVKIIQTYLAPDHIAKSDEFIVDYQGYGKQRLLLCGLQEYIKGEILDPWSNLDKNHLVLLSRYMGFEKAEDSDREIDQWLHRIREKTENFIGKLRRVILETNHVPDLAGVGNLILTRSGAIKLVDINNISRVSFDAIINLDDRGYPVCDKSIEALTLLEQKFLGRSTHRDDLIYKTYLDPERMKDVKAVEERFHLSMNPAASYSEAS